MKVVVPLMILVMSFTCSAKNVSVTDFLNQQAALLNAPIRVTVANEHITLSCRQQSHTFPLLKNQDILVQTYPNFQMIAIPMAMGYGDVNIYYRLITVTSHNCFDSLPAEGTVSNPVFHGMTLDTSMSSRGTTTESHYQIAHDGHLVLNRRYDNVGGYFCLQTYPGASVPLRHCQTGLANVYQIITTDKVHFYATETTQRPRAAYLIKGDRIHLLDFNMASGRFKVRYQGKRITTGWIDSSAINWAKWDEGETVDP